jgi:hypothetical protein
VDGPVRAASLATAASFFPEPVQVVLERQPFVIVPYDLWKEKVKSRQQEE